jgi:alpha-acetolactate decarboxylase
MSGVSRHGITTSRLLEKGNHGLGTFVRMNGELILLDGTVYQLQAGGKVRIADATDEIPYAIATHFEPQQTQSVMLESKASIDGALDAFAPQTNNLFISYRIDGVFRSIKCRTVKGQEYDDQPLSELGKKQAVADYENIEGTVVGYRVPQIWQGIFVAGEHMHFISERKDVGGHVLELSTGGSEVQLGIAIVKDIHIELPTSENFNAAVLKTDDVGLRAVEG